MAEWTITQPIDYSPNGDDVDSFAQKVKYTLEQIYLCLQQLHANGAQAGLNGEAAPYEMRVDTTTRCIYMRNADNSGWVFLGELAENFGLTPDKISAVKCNGGLKNMTCGTDLTKPSVGNEVNDLYFAIDTSRLYMWTGSEWRLFSSLVYADLLNITSVENGGGFGKLLCGADSSKPSVGNSVNDFYFATDTLKVYVWANNSWELFSSRQFSDILNVTSVENGGGFGKLFCGEDALKPVANNTLNDIYFATDTLKIYVWQDNSWQLLLSRHFGDILESAQFCVQRSELTTLGGVINAGKVLQLDNETGKANVDITGSTNKVNNRVFVLDNPVDGDIITYDEPTNSFISKHLTIGSASAVTVPVSSSGTPNETIRQLSRTIEDLHVALTTAGLDTTYYDSMALENFLDSGVTDLTQIPVETPVLNSDTLTLTNPNDIFKLIRGATYFLNGNSYSGYKITEFIINGSQYSVRVNPAIRGSIQAGVSSYLVRSNDTRANQGYFLGSSSAPYYLVTTPIPFINKETGEGRDITSVSVNVQHENKKDLSITAQVALIKNAQFIKGEVLTVGTGSPQQIVLNNHSNVQPFGFKLYFNGVEQSPSNFKLLPDTGAVIFTAAIGDIVTADYYCNWSDEQFVSMTKTGTYTSIKSPDFASTQFIYVADSSARVGNIAIIKLGFGSQTGTDVSRYLGVSTGTAQAFKIPHNATQNTIQMTPANSSWTWNQDLGVLVATASAGQTLTVTYNYTGVDYKCIGYSVVCNE